MNCTTECKNGNSKYKIGKKTVCLEECPTKFFKNEGGMKTCILPRDCTYRVENTFECVDKCGKDYYLKENAICTKTRCEYFTEDHSCTTAENCKFFNKVENDTFCVTKCKEGWMQQPKSDGRTYCQESCDTGYRKSGL